MIDLTRRRFLVGLAGVAAVVAAPSLVRAGSIMPVRALPTLGDPIVHIGMAGDRSVTVFGINKYGERISEVVRLTGDQGAITLANFLEITSMIAERDDVPAPDFGCALIVESGWRDDYEERIPYVTPDELPTRSESWFMPTNRLLADARGFAISATDRAIVLERRPPPSRWPLRMFRRETQPRRVTDPIADDRDD